MQVTSDWIHAINVTGAKQENAYRVTGKIRGQSHGQLRHKKQSRQGETLWKMRIGSAPRT